MPEDLIDRIIDDATLAPNAGKNQPWEFIVIRDKKLIREMSDDSKTSILVDIKKNPDSAFKIYKKALQNQNFNVFYNAPCLVCIVGRAGVPTMVMDCSLAAGYLMLSATSLGLGTCWVELGKQIRDPDLLKIIRLPDGYEIYAPLSLVTLKKFRRYRKEKNLKLSTSKLERNNHGYIQRQNRDSYRRSFRDR